MSDKNKKLLVMALAALGLMVLPLVLQNYSNGYVRIVDMALLYVMLALGLNIVVGYAGLLDLGYIAFFAVGAYTYGLIASPHLVEAFPAVATMFPDGVPYHIIAVVLVAALVAAFFGALLGAPTLKLRGDYLAIVTLGFGEIIRIFMLNLDRPINITNGPKGLDAIAPVTLFGHPFSQSLDFELSNGDIYSIESVSLYYYLFLALVVLTIFISSRLEDSRIGRAWMAIREDEIAAKAMGLNTRNLKLLAFAMGASFGGVSGVMFSSFQRFVSPESFSLMESVMVVAMVVLGGLGHIPGVVLGALMLAGLPEVLRYAAGPLTELTDGRLAPEILRQLLIALAMIIIMLLRPRGLWPTPEHGKNLKRMNGKEAA